jgi:hypothetical protein
VKKIVVCVQNNNLGSGKTVLYREKYDGIVILLIFVVSIIYNIQSKARLIVVISSKCIRYFEIKPLFG